MEVTQHVTYLGLDIGRPDVELDTHMDDSDDDSYPLPGGEPPAGPYNIPRAAARERMPNV